MSGVHEVNRKRRPPKMFLLSTDLRVQDQVDGTVCLRRGNICLEQESSKSRSENLWVKVQDNGTMVKIEKNLLIEVPPEFMGLLEPVSDPETRLKLLNNPGKLQYLASLSVGTPLWVHMGHSDELGEAELRYIGPLNRGSNAVFFGVQLKGSAAGKGIGNGSYKGQRIFVCPDASALFLPVNHIRVRHWSRNNGSEPQERHREKEHNHRTNNPSSNGHSNHQPNNGQNTERTSHQQQSRHISFLHHQPSISQSQFVARTTESTASAAADPPRILTATQPFQIGQRVSFQQEEFVCRGEVRFCGHLPGRSSSGIYVGILLDTPDGSWDGFHKGEKLCHIPSPIYGQLLSASKVSPEIKSHRTSALTQIPKSILKPLPPAVKSSSVSPTVSTMKIALLPPTKPAAKPPLVPPKPALQPPPLPPPKPHFSKPSLTQTEQQQHANGTHDLPSPLWSPDHGEITGDDAEVFLEGEFEVGSMVEVNDPPLFGVIRWIGQISGISDPVAGIELDQELSAGTDGSYLGERHFRCPPNKGLFVKLKNCRRDSRFPAPEAPVNQVERCNSIAFAEWGSERVEDHTPPVEGDEARELYEGWKKGIQGHLNSCYLDATLFSLFSCCSSADWLLFWPTDPKTDPGSNQAQDLLRCEIVNPLRRSGYVCASKTMALRRLLEAANSDMGFTNQEKDPEEFINKLFQLLRVEPLLKIRSMTRDPQECHLYQLFPPSLPSSPSPMSPSSPQNSLIPLHSPSSNQMRVASVQNLLESSFHHAGLKFVEAPSCLLLLMPRFGKDFKMFDVILPTLTLDITDLLDDSLRQCTICQAVAEWECFQCYEDLDITPGQLKQYCKTCNTQVHSHKKRTSHSPVEIAVPDGQWSGSPSCARQLMSLFAVTCIETSHYVSFVKHGPLLTDWLFFDSMADREGGENGFNIPQVKPCPEVGRYLSLSEADLGRINPASLKESTRRLLCDSYMCLYHSPELSLYK